MTTAFLFPGLNALKRRKDRERFLRCPEICKHIQTAQQILNDQYQLNLSAPNYLYQPEQILYNQQNLACTAVLNTTIQIAIASKLQQIINTPEWVMGYSQGDIARSTVAGIIDFEHAIKIVYQFFNSVKLLRTAGESYGIRSPAKQPFTNADLNHFQDLGIDVSRFTPRYILCSCSLQNSPKIRQLAKTRNWQISNAFFNYPVHSRLLRPMIAQSPYQALNTEYHKPEIQVYSSILNKPVMHAHDLEQESHTGFYLPIKWLQSINQLVRQHKVTRVVNIGPCRSISLMLRETPVQLKVYEADKLIYPTVRKTYR